MPAIRELIRRTPELPSDDQVVNLQEFAQEVLDNPSHFTPEYIESLLRVDVKKCGQAKLEATKLKGFKEAVAAFVQSRRQESAELADLAQATAVLVSNYGANVKKYRSLYIPKERIPSAEYDRQCVESALRYVDSLDDDEVAPWHINGREELVAPEELREAIVNYVRTGFDPDSAELILSEERLRNSPSIDIPLSVRRLGAGAVLMTIATTGSMTGANAAETAPSAAQMNDTVPISVEVSTQKNSIDNILQPLDKLDAEIESDSDSPDVNIDDLLSPSDSEVALDEDEAFEREINEILGNDDELAESDEVAGVELQDKGNNMPTIPERKPEAEVPIVKNDTPESKVESERNPRDEVLHRDINEKIEIAKGAGRTNLIDQNELFSYLKAGDDKYKHPLVTSTVVLGLVWEESKLELDAGSGAGAMGLCQFMEDTAVEYGIDPYSPQQCVDAAFRYLIKSHNVIKADPRFASLSDGEQVGLALASYNAGLSAVLKAGGVPSIYETINYVDRISSDVAHVYGKQDAAGRVSASSEVDSSVNTVASPLENKPVDTPEAVDVSSIETIGYDLGEFKYYNQMEEPWKDKPYRFNNSPESGGDIALCGCGPTSFASAISSITGKEFNPQQSAELFMDNGGPVSQNYCASNWIWDTKPVIFEEQGVKVYRIDATEEAFKAAIENDGANNGQIIMSQGAGMFTSEGHIMGVRGYKNLENTYGGDVSFLLNDSANRANTEFEGGYAFETLHGGALAKGGKPAGNLQAAWAVQPL